MMPVGRWVMRTAESVVLTCWPPEPEARMVSMRMSSARISMSTSSASGKHGDRGGRGVDAAAAFGRRHALDAVDARLELQLREHALARDGGDDFLEAADVAVAGRSHLEAPALRGGVALIHAEEVAGEERRLVAAGAGADFEDGVASRRPRPWAEAGSGFPAAAPRCGPRPRACPSRRARASRRRCPCRHSIASRSASSCSAPRSSRILATSSCRSEYSDASFT